MQAVKQTTGWHIALWLFLGSLLLQAAWIAAVPPFRGIDEFEHAFRAASVAEGHLMPGPVVVHGGRGNLVVAPERLVTAATVECESYAYTERKNCSPVTYLGHGKVTVASAAATYNPVFYWLIGTPALWFTGVTSLYIMRIASAILCSGMLGLAAWLTTRWSNTGWPLVGLVAAMTPVTVYSTAMPAPNGVEMMAGLALWAGLLGLASRQIDRHRERHILIGVTPAVVALATVRLLGPLWLAMICVCVACVLGRYRIQSLWKQHSGLLLVVGGSLAAATLGGLWWSSIAGTDTPVDFRLHHHFSDPVPNSLMQIPLWVIQCIAAFPTRNEPAPTFVYAVGLLIFSSVLVLGGYFARGRMRFMLFCSAASSIIVPLVLTIITFSRIGPEWQGRYGLPFACGIPLLVGLALDNRKTRHRLIGPGLLGGWIALAVAQTLSISHVLIMERRESPLAGTAEWPIPPLWLIVALSVCGMGFWALPVVKSGKLHNTALDLAISKRDRAPVDLVPATTAVSETLRPRSPDGTS